jgi:putative GTP pyrophosphokinase
MDISLNEVWKESPDLIRKYYDMLPSYQRLCDEISYILNKKIVNNKIEIGHLTSRAKTLRSFCEKISRKKYNAPFSEITDISGVRIVYLYTSDRLNLERIIEGEFNIHEKVDKVKDQDLEKFGYGALHYIVSLKEQHAGARYDDLREMKCEIQVRTILQDAWAIVAHHLSYKQEEDVPHQLKRRLHALSGLFEIADDQFENLNRVRSEYQAEVKEAIGSKSKSVPVVELNLDSLLSYMAWRFPDRDTASKEAAADLLQELNRFGYRDLSSIDEAYNKAEQAVLASEAKYPPSEPDDDEPGRYVGVGLIRCALEFTNEKYRVSRKSVLSINRVAEFVHLLK